jgi:hypothetical protein
MKLLRIGKYELLEEIGRAGMGIEDSVVREEKAPKIAARRRE